MKQKIKILSCLSIASVILSSYSSAAELSRELILFQEIPTVFTASKKEQAVSESPSAVSIITDEDIKAYGASNIPDILRNVAGVDVMAISATDINVNIRGFNKDASHKLLVLIDGRSVYLDFMGIVLWESLPVTMEEIKRIEIVKGPGSAIWGGNAYSGVINIVTKRPSEMIGTVLSGSYGELNTKTGSVTHGGKSGETSYRITAGWKQGDNWDENRWGAAVVRDENDLALEDKKGSFLIERDLQGDSSLTVSGGVDEASGEVLTAMDMFERDNTTSYLKLDYQRGWLRFHTYWNSLDTGIKETVNTGRYDINTDTYDLELQGVFNTSSGNSLVAGTSYRINSVDSGILSGHHRQEIFGLYVQDDFRPTPKLLLTAGARYDEHPLAGGNTSPRAAIVYSPRDGHTIRLSYTTAYSLPTFVESYLYRDIPYPFFTVSFKGNKEVGPEKIRSWECGYQGQITERIKGSADLFYNELRDFITFLPTPENPLVYTFYNQGDYKAKGGELSLDFYLAKDLTARANYSYQYIWNEEAGTRVRYSPLSKANAELRYSPKEGLNSTIWVNHVAETSWTSSAMSENWEYPNSLTTRAGTDPVLDSYLLFNMKIGYRFTEGTELSLSSFNLLNDNHREFISGDNIGRRVSANLTARF